MTRVSVIIPTYNMASYLVDAVRSAIDDTSVDREIIVVDDGSTDASAEMIKPYLEQIRYIRKDPNAGLAEARNTAIEAAQGEYLRLLDADDVLVRGSLAQQAAVLDRQPDAAMVWGQAHVMDENGEVYEQRVSKPPTRRELVPSKPAFRRLLRGNLVCASAVAIRRSVLETTGLFDARSEPGEDWGLWLMIANRFDVAYTPVPVAYYRTHAESITANYTVEGALASHVHSLERVYSAPGARFPETQRFAYACLNATMALNAARLQDRPAVIRHLARSIRRRPLHLAHNMTWSAMYETAKSFAPAPAVSAIRRLKRSGRTRLMNPVPSPFTRNPVRRASAIPVKEELDAQS